MIFVTKQVYIVWHIWLKTETSWTTGFQCVRKSIVFMSNANRTQWNKKEMNNITPQIAFNFWQHSNNGTFVTDVFQQSVTKFICMSVHLHYMTYTCTHMLSHMTMWSSADNTFQLQLNFDHHSNHFNVKSTNVKSRMVGCWKCCPWKLILLSSLSKHKQTILLCHSKVQWNDLRLRSIYSDVFFLINWPLDGGRSL